jgi:ABC-type dipeptide/oligopeptide/nickel transport system ATPase component
LMNISSAVQAAETAMREVLKTLEDYRQRTQDNPLHPFTRALMPSVPRLDGKWEEMSVALKARQSQPGGGCAYHERSHVAEKKLGCEVFRPSLIEVDPVRFGMHPLHGSVTRRAGWALPGHSGDAV